MAKGIRLPEVELLNTLSKDANNTHSGDTLDATQMTPNPETSKPRNLKHD